MKSNKVKCRNNGMNNNVGSYLFSSLSPLRVMTHYSGIFLDWCYSPISNNASYSGILFVFLLRMAISFLAFLSITAMAVFEVWQTVQKVLSPSWKAILKN